MMKIQNTNGIYLFQDIGEIYHYSVTLRTHTLPFFLLPQRTRSTTQNLVAPLVIWYVALNVQ